VKIRYNGIYVRPCGRVKEEEWVVGEDEVTCAWERFVAEFERRKISNFPAMCGAAFLLGPKVVEKFTGMVGVIILLILTIFVLLFIIFVLY
jgi:hypothetical protein